MCAASPRMGPTGLDFPKSVPYFPFCPTENRKMGNSALKRGQKRQKGQRFHRPAPFSPVLSHLACSGPRAGQLVMQSNLEVSDGDGAQGRTPRCPDRRDSDFPVAVARDTALRRQESLDGVSGVLSFTRIFVLITVIKVIGRRGARQWVDVIGSGQLRGRGGRRLSPFLSLMKDGFEPGRGSTSSPWTVERNG